MDFAQTREYLLARPESREDFPFGPDVHVFKILDKMFATLAYDNDTPNMNLKRDPDEALALRDIFPGVKPGYHMNKRHWNTVVLDGSVPASEIERMIDNSYSLVVKGAGKGPREGLILRHGHEVIFR